MSSRPSTSETGLTGGLDVLRPDDVTSDGLPIAMRGYDRNRVDRLLTRVSQDYLHVWLQRDTLRERVRSLEAEVQAAEGEARASATSVAELVQRVAALEKQLAQARAAREELEAQLARSEGEREEAVRRGEAGDGSSPAVAELMQRVATLERELAGARVAKAELEAQLARTEGEREEALRRGETVERPGPAVAELAQRVATLEGELAQARAARVELEAQLARSEGEREEAVYREGPGERPGPPEPAASATSVAPQAPGDGEAARLLLSAARASAELRELARERAQSTLKAARERAVSIAAETKRERNALDEMQQRRREVERVADELLARARAEAEHVAAAIGQERDRVRGLLSGALASLDAGVEASSANLLADLSARLRETGETDSAAPPPVSDPGP